MRQYFLVYAVKGRIDVYESSDCSCVFVNSDSMSLVNSVKASAVDLGFQNPYFGSLWLHVTFYMSLSKIFKIQDSKAMGRYELWCTDGFPNFLIGKITSFSNFLVLGFLHSRWSWKFLLVFLYVQVVACRALSKNCC